MDLFVFFKILSTLLVVIPIVLLTKASKRDLASIYLTKGRFRLGLIIGLVLFLFFLVTSTWTSTLLYGGKDLTFEKAVSWAPLIFVFVFSNGIKEEIQFRGLFIGKYEEFFGVDQSNLLQAIPFALAHIGETYSPVMVLFIFLVFLLGLAFGAITQKTNSLIGSILFHAGADIPVILGIFSNL
jgi:membrane protease YdiL (CAAX protease family)